MSCVHLLCLHWDRNSRPTSLMNESVLHEDQHVVARCFRRQWTNKTVCCFSRRMTCTPRTFPVESQASEVCQNRFKRWSTSSISGDKSIPALTELDRIQRDRFSVEVVINVSHQIDYWSSPLISCYHQQSPRCIAPSENLYPHCRACRLICHEWHHCWWFEGFSWLSGWRYARNGLSFATIVPNTQCQKLAGATVTSDCLHFHTPQLPGFGYS